MAKQKDSACLNCANKNRLWCKYCSHRKPFYNASDMFKKKTDPERTPSLKWQCMPGDPDRELQLQAYLNGLGAHLFIQTKDMAKDVVPATLEIGSICGKHKETALTGSSPNNCMLQAEEILLREDATYNGPRTNKDEVYAVIAEKPGATDPVFIGLWHGAQYNVKAAAVKASGLPIDQIKLIRANKKFVRNLN